MSIEDGWSEGEEQRDQLAECWQQCWGTQWNYDFADYLSELSAGMLEAIDRRDAEIARLEWRLQACEETRAELERSFNATVVEVERLLAGAPGLDEGTEP